MIRMLCVNTLLLCALLVSSCTVRPLLPQKDVCDPAPFYIPEKVRVALVLGSGGVRGMAHVGVLEELEANGIYPDLIIGCSAGSLVGALYADNPCLESIKEAVWSIDTDSVLDISVWKCRFGLSQGSRMRRVLNKHLCAKTFEELKIPLVVVAADLHSGELVPMGAGDLVSAVQSSCSIPFVFVPCERDGRVYIDGGTINPVPAIVARDLGAEIVIAVDLCELLPKTFPTNLFGILDRATEIAFMWQNEVCTRHADVVIRPKTCGVGCFNDKAKQQLYEAGQHAARKKMAQIKELVRDLQPQNCARTRLFSPKCYTPDIFQDLWEELCTVPKDLCEISTTEEETALGGVIFVDDEEEAELAEVEIIAANS